VRLPFDYRQVTIRDLQKGISMIPEEDLNACRWHAWPRGFAGQPALEYAWFGLGCPSRNVMLARLASLAARYGARALFSEALALERERAAKSESAEQSRGPDSEAQETSGAFRPKGTDEVAPSEGANAEASVHGGDGASQEVPDGASKGGDKQSGSANSDKAGLAGPADDQAQKSAERQRQSADSGHPETGNTTSGAGPSDGAADNVMPHFGGARGGQAQDSSEGEAASAPSGALEPIEAPNGAGDHDAMETPQLTGGANLTPQRDVTAVPKEENDARAAEGDAGPIEAKDSGAANDDVTAGYCYKSMASSAREVHRALKKYGGRYGTLGATRVSPTIVKQVRRALERLVSFGQYQDGPRLDAQEFCERLIAHRPLYPARLEEEARTAVLVLPDVSGSCAGFSDRTLVVAKAAAELGVHGADVIVVAHSNGYPQEFKVNNQKEKRTSDCEIEGRSSDALEFYTSLLKRYRVEVVVAMGDGDAEWLYELLASLPAVHHFIWMDNWSCNNLPEPQDRTSLLPGLHRWPRRLLHKTTYIVGCDTEEHFIAGLEQAGKRRG